MRTWQKIRTSTFGRHVRGYEEAGDQVRFHFAPGDVVFHDPFEAHLDRFPATGAEVLNLRLPTRRGYALAELLASAIPHTPPPTDWPDELAATLLRNPSLRLSAWAEKHGLAPWTVSRGFAQLFGVSPEAFRARVRARRALRSIESTEQPLADVAANLGFSDQPHMTRSIRQLTGRAPTAWRPAANAFKTPAAPAV
jgi:AraC-like DNA-binding protein